MAKNKTKDLKDQYLFRVYDEDESEVLHRAITKFKDKFDSLNDAIKYFALVGADKMLGDNTLNQSIKFQKYESICKALMTNLPTYLAGRKWTLWKQTLKSKQINHS